MTNPVSLCAGKKGLLFAITLLQLAGAKSREGRWGRGARQRIYSSEKDSLLQKQSSGIVRE